MTDCWVEGELRAYLDGELPAGEMERAAGHLLVCPECEGRRAELAGRASRVSALLADLREPGTVERISPARRTVPQWGWRVAAAALAAGLVLGAWIIPRRTEQPKAPAAPQTSAESRPPEPAFSVPEAPEPAPVVSRPARPRVRVAARRPRPRIEAQPEAPATGYYLALDNEPVETGVVMRVGLNNNRVQADILFGPDGRAHAIRLVHDEK